MLSVLLLFCRVRFLHPPAWHTLPLRLLDQLTCPLLLCETLISMAETTPAVAPRAGFRQHSWRLLTPVDFSALFPWLLEALSLGGPARTWSLAPQMATE